MLSTVRRVAFSSGAKRISQNATRFSSTFVEREKGAEAKYIRDQEDARKKVLREQMEKILAMEDSHSQKQELVGVLENKAPETFLTRMQKWNYFVPVGILVGVPALTNEFLVIDMETQILGAFLFTMGAIYNEFGTAIGGAVDDEIKVIEDDCQKVDAVMLKGVHEAVSTNENLLDLETQVKDIHALTDDMAVVQADYLNHLEEHKFKDSVARKLDSLIALEDTATNAIRNRMMKKVQGDVVTAFKSDAKAKQSALDQALAVLASSTATTTGAMKTDIVGSYFASSLKSYKDAYAKQAPGSDDIIKQLEKDMANIMKAPVVSHQGGNVYEFKAKAAAAH